MSWMFNFIFLLFLHFTTLEEKFSKPKPGRRKMRNIRGLFFRNVIKCGDRKSKTVNYTPALAQISKSQQKKSYLKDFVFIIPLHPNELCQHCCSYNTIFYFEKQQTVAKTKSLSVRMISSVCFFFFYLMLLHDEVNCPSFFMLLSMTIHDVVITLRKMRWRETERREGFLTLACGDNIPISSGNRSDKNSAWAKRRCLCPEGTKAWVIDRRLENKNTFFVSCAEWNEISVKFIPLPACQRIRNGCRLLPTHKETEPYEYVLCFLDVFQPGGQMMEQRNEYRNEILKICWWQF